MKPGVRGDYHRWHVAGHGPLGSVREVLELPAGEWTDQWGGAVLGDGDRWGCALEGFQAIDREGDVARIDPVKCDSVDLFRGLGP